MFGGVEYATQKTDLKEDHLFQNISLNLRMLRYFFSFTLLLAYAFTFDLILPTSKSFYVYIGFFIHTISLIGIVNASYRGHFLFIGVINSSFALMNLLNNDKSNLSIIFGITVIIFLYISHLILEKNKDIKIDTKNFKVLYLQRFIKIILPLFIINLFVSIVLPKKLKFFNEQRIIKKLVKSKKKNNYTKSLNDFQLFNKDKTTSNHQNIYKNETRNLSLDKEQLLNMLNNIPSLAPGARLKLISSLFGNIEMGNDGINNQNKLSVNTNLKDLKNKLNKIPNIDNNAKQKLIKEILKSSYANSNLEKNNKNTYTENSILLNQIKKIENLDIKTKNELRKSILDNNERMQESLENLSERSAKAQKDIEGINEYLKSVPNVSNQITNDFKDTLSQLQKNNSNMRDLKSNKTFSKKNFNEMFNGLEQISQNMEKRNRRFSRYLDDVENSSQKFPGTYNDELNEKLNNEVFNERFKSLQDSVRNFNQTIKKEKRELARQEKNIKKVSATIKKIKKSNKRTKKKEKKLKKILDKVRVILIVFFIVAMLYFFRLFNKSPSKPVFTEVDELQVAQALSEVKKIQLKKLTPNQEIIKSYNIYKKLIKDNVYIDSEVPPPEKLYFKTQSKINIKNPNWIVTNLFCDCFYGNKNANDKELKRFRKAFKSMLTKKVALN